MKNTSTIPVVERHQIATTAVEVYRLFKIQDIGKTLACSTDNIINSLGQQVAEQTRYMLKPYIEQQQAAIERQKIKAERAERRQARAKKSKPIMGAPFMVGNFKRKRKRKRKDKQYLTAGLHLRSKK